MSNIIDDTDWKVIYDIEERVENDTVLKKDIESLLEIIYKVNGNVIHPKLHKHIQSLINSKEPLGNCSCNKMDALGRIIFFIKEYLEKKEENKNESNMSR